MTANINQSRDRATSRPGEDIKSAIKIGSTSFDQMYAIGVFQMNEEGNNDSQ